MAREVVELLAPVRPGPSSTPRSGAAGTPGSSSTPAPTCAVLGHRPGRRRPWRRPGTPLAPFGRAGPGRARRVRGPRRGIVSDRRRGERRGGAVRPGCQQPAARPSRRAASPTGPTRHSTCAWTARRSSPRRDVVNTYDEDRLADDHPDVRRGALRAPDRGSHRRAPAAAHDRGARRRGQGRDPGAGAPARRATRRGARSRPSAWRSTGSSRTSPTGSTSRCTCSRPAAASSCSRTTRSRTAW